MAIDPSTAFVSYSREDREFVLRLAKDLKAKGAKIWMDTLDIRPGQTWADEIQAAVTSCSRMLMVLSPASVASRNVQAEVGYAISEGKEIIPIFHRQCTIPFRLLPFQYADFRCDYSVGLEELLLSLSGAGPGNGKRAAATEVPTDTGAEAEVRRWQSSIRHNRLAEQHKLAAAEHARMEQEERERGEVSEKARRELERQRVVAEQARLGEEHQQSAAQEAGLQQPRAERKAGVDKFATQELHWRVWGAGLVEAESGQSD